MLSDAKHAFVSVERSLSYRSLCVASAPRTPPKPNCQQAPSKHAVLSLSSCILPTGVSIGKTFDVSSKFRVLTQLHSHPNAHVTCTIHHIGCILIRERHSSVDLWRCSAAWVGVHTARQRAYEGSGRLSYHFVPFTSAKSTSRGTEVGGIPTCAGIVANRNGEVR